MREMAPAEVSQFIRSNRTGVLGSADGGRTYCVPLYYAYDGQGETIRGERLRHDRDIILSDPEGSASESSLASSREPSL